MASIPTPDEPASTGPEGDDVAGETGWVTPPATLESTARELGAEWMARWEEAWHSTPESWSERRPAQELFVRLLDDISERALGRPLRPRVDITPAGLLRGEIDAISFELPAYAVAGLVIDRFVVEAEHLRVRPGLPAVFVAEPVRVTAVVSQANVDRWASRRRLPFRLRLTERGVVTTTKVGAFRISEVLTTPEVSNGFLKLTPTEASVLGMPAPMMRFFRSYLPLPPLPRDAELDDVETRDGELALRFRIDRFEQPLTPDLAGRMASTLGLKLPGLG